MKRKDGQVSLAHQSDADVYRSLKVLCDKGLESSGEYWNWPLAGYLTLPSLQRILNLAWIYEMQKSSSGSILEFGVHYGSSFAQLINLRRYGTVQLLSTFTDLILSRDSWVLLTKMVLHLKVTLI